MKLDDLTAEEQSIIADFQKLDKIERLILLTGLKAAVAKSITEDQFTSWMSERMNRHRSGEELTVADLAPPSSGEAEDET